MNSGLFLERSEIFVDLVQIRNNYRAYKRALGEAVEIISVIKANAYGHGDIQIARVLVDEGANFFAVSNINEGIRLRRGGIKGEIIILGYTPPALSGELFRYDLTQTIVSKDHLSELLHRGKSSVKYYIAIDTGMNRIGIPPLEVAEITKSAQGALNIIGAFTHLPVADGSFPCEIEFTKNEIDVFDRVCEEMRCLGIEFFHCQNSAASLRYCSKISTSIRLGISLYGYSPSKNVKLPEGVEPALAWKSIICRVSDLKAGESVGYGRSFIAPKSMKIATVTTGYADGYPRRASNIGAVLVNGEKCPIVGRICMDMMMVDVGNISNVKAGDVAVLIGQWEKQKITADDIAAWSKTISYEILTSISQRVNRVYIEG